MFDPANFKKGAGPIVRCFEFSADRLSTVGDVEIEAQLGGGNP